MKTRALGLFLFVLATVFLGCGKDNDPKPSGNASVGTFKGNLLVADDPQTELGYIYNTRVAVSTSGSTATVKVTGDLGFEREYTGTFTSQQNVYTVTLTKQTKPSEKVVSGTVLVVNNTELAIEVNVANETVTAKTSTTSAETVQISGKISMIGTTLLKE